MTRRAADGSQTLLADAPADVRRAVVDAVREARGERALRPAETLADAEADVRACLVVPEWRAGDLAADVAADVLRLAYGVDAAEAPLAWSLYTEAARRIGFAGAVPVPTWERAGAAANA